MRRPEHSLGQDLLPRLNADLVEQAGFGVRVVGSKLFGFCDVFQLEDDQRTVHVVGTIEGRTGGLELVAETFQVIHVGGAVVLADLQMAWLVETVNNIERDRFSFCG